MTLLTGVLASDQSVSTTPAVPWLVLFAEPLSGVVAAVAATQVAVAVLVPAYVGLAVNAQVYWYSITWPASSDRSTAPHVEVPATRLDTTEQLLVASLSPL